MSVLQYIIHHEEVITFIELRARLCRDLPPGAEGASMADAPKERWGFAMPNVRRVLSLPLAVVLVAFSLAACNVSPSSRTAAESTNAVTLAGFAFSGGESIAIQAVDQNTGALVSQGAAVSASSGASFKTPSGFAYKLYPWTFNAGVLAPNFWAPQTIIPDLETSQGHLEIFASSHGSNLPTFSQAAFNSLMASGLDPLTGGAKYADGDSTVLFDQNGVGNGPETGWVNAQGMISDSHSPYYSPVAWSVGSYSVQGKTIYGLICTPTTGGSNPIVIYNHGGIVVGGVNVGGNLNGSVTTSGWTEQPSTGPDELGQCIDWAKRGWVVAMSAYRGESVSIASASPDFAANSWTSDGDGEFCLGEVTDTLALADLVLNHSSSIKVGSPSHEVPLNVNGKLLMYGYSHGGCVTYRAVEQGAPVTAFAVIEGFTDMSLNYLNWRAAGQSEQASATAAGAFTTSGGYFLPDASGVMGYNWRSAHYFASRGDLKIQKFRTMPILILHGDVDFGNPVFLDEPALISADIGATNIFVGPKGFPEPTSQPCIAGPVGAPIPGTVTAPTASCPISFMAMNAGDPCVSATTPPLEMPLCKVVALPLAPAAGEPQQLHYLVVFHNMNHTNGGLAIKYTFDRFVELNLDRQPGCDGLEIDCASD